MMGCEFSDFFATHTPHMHHFNIISIKLLCDIDEKIRDIMCSTHVITSAMALIPLLDKQNE